MLKKILLGAAMLATSSFATYSQFPVPQANSGEVKVYTDFTMQDKRKAWDLGLKGRFVPVQNLEIWLQLPFTLMTRWGGEDTKGDGMKNLTFGGRYQITQNVAAFLDMTFPTGKKRINDDGLTFNLGAQYSQNFGTIDLGSELGFIFHTEGSDKFKAAPELHLNVEVDPIVSQTISPYIGLDLYIVVGDPKFDGHKSGDTSGNVGVFPYLGANFKITEIFSADLCAIFGFGKDYVGDKTPITLEASFNASF